MESLREHQFRLPLVLRTDRSTMRLDSYVSPPRQALWPRMHRRGLGAQRQARYAAPTWTCSAIGQAAQRPSAPTLHPASRGRRRSPQLLFVVLQAGSGPPSRVIVDAVGRVGHHEMRTDIPENLGHVGGSVLSPNRSRWLPVSHRSPVRETGGR